MVRTVILLLITGVMGCTVAEYEDTATPPQTNETTGSTEQPIYLVTIDQDSQTGFRATLPDGTEIYDLEQFSNYLPTLNKWAEDNNYTLQIQLDENLDRTLQYDMNSQDHGDYGYTEFPLVQQVGQYTLSTGGGRRGLGGCIRTEADYYAVRLNYGSYNAGNFRQVFDMHFARFNRGGRVCFGYYESVRGWTACQCEPPPMRWVRDHIYEIAIAAGVGATTAAIISAITAPLVTGAAFAL